MARLGSREAGWGESAWPAEGRVGQDTRHTSACASLSKGLAGYLCSAPACAQQEFRATRRADSWICTGGRNQRKNQLSAPLPRPAPPVFSAGIMLFSLHVGVARIPSMKACRTWIGQTEESASALDTFGAQHPFDTCGIVVRTG